MSDEKKRFSTVNKAVACTPFPRHSVDGKKLSSGLVIAVPRTNLVALTVLADYEPLDLVVGDKAYVPLEYSNSSWGKGVVEVEGVGEFILVPAEQVYLVERGQRSGSYYDVYR